MPPRIIVNNEIHQQGITRIQHRIERQELTQLQIVLLQELDEQLSQMEKFLQQLQHLERVYEGR